MPWTARDAARHVDGLTPHQAVVWARVANSALRACTASGGTAAECDGRAIRQANAVAQRAPKKSVKSVSGGGLDILAIPFGGPFEGGDADGEFFTERTELCLDWFPTQRPLLYEHGLVADGPGITAIGHVDAATAHKTDEGWWVRAELDRHHKYFAEIERLLEEEALFSSSGAMPHLVRKSHSGEILRWPWIEQSLTPIPANLFSLVTPAEAKSHYKSAGLTPPPTIDTELPYLERVDRLTDDASELLDLTRRLTAGRAKVGRPQLSDARRQRLTALLEELGAFLRETAPRGAGVTDEREDAAPAAPDEAEGAESAETAPEAAGKAAPAPAPAPDPAATGTAESAGKAAAHAPELVALYQDFAAQEAFYARLAAAQPGS